MRGTRLVPAAVVVLIAGLVGAATGAANPLLSQRPGADDPLLGNWVTRPVPVATIRSALLAARFTRADVQQYLDELGFSNAKNLRFSLTFSHKGTENHALQKFWDAAKKPSGGDDGFYKVQAGQKVTISSTHPEARPWSEIFTYRIQGNQLKLRFISAKNPKETAKQLRFDRVVMTAAAVAPYVKMS